MRLTPLSVVLSIIYVLTPTHYPPLGEQNPTLVQTTDKSTPSKTRAGECVREAEKQWNQARLQNDVEALDRLLSEDCVFMHADGKLETKAHYIADVKSNDRKYEYINEDEISVRVYGDAAVLTGRIRSKGHLREQPLGGDLRFTRVYVKRQGRWQMVASHSSSIAHR